MSADNATDLTKSVIEQPLMKLLGKYRGQISAILPKQFDGDRVLKLIVGAINKTPDLMKCTPMSVVNAVLTAASIGLEIRPNSAYLIPFAKNWKGDDGKWHKRFECQLVIDYRGKIDLALRSGRILDIDPDIVYSKDKFRIYRDETGMKAVEHEPILYKTDDAGNRLPISEDDRGVPLGVLVVATIKDGKPKVLFMPWLEIMKIKARSKSSDSGPWVTDVGEMSKKTAIHRICKTLPQSPEMAIANQVDDANETGVNFDVIDMAPEDYSSDEPMVQQSVEAAEQVAQRKIAEMQQRRAKAEAVDPQAAVNLAGHEDRPTVPRENDHEFAATHPVKTQPVKQVIRHYEGTEFPENPEGDVIVWNSAEYRFNEDTGNYQKSPTQPTAHTEPEPPAKQERAKPVFGRRDKGQGA